MGFDPFTLADNLPHFDPLYVGKYYNSELPSDGVSDAVPVQNNYDSSFPFHPILCRKEIYNNYLIHYTHMLIYYVKYRACFFR